MKTRLKLSLAALLTLLMVFAWYVAVSLMNMPNTMAAIAGFLVFLVIFILGPTGYWLIFRRKKSNDSQETSTN